MEKEDKELDKVFEELNKYLHKIDEVYNKKIGIKHLTPKLSSYLGVTAKVSTYLGIVNFIYLKQLEAKIDTLLQSVELKKILESVKKE